MVHIAQVLCPVDFSDFSRRALHHAAAIARWYEARLTILHVFATLPAWDLPPVTLDEKDRARLADELRRFASGLPHEVPCDFVVREAPDVHREILDHVLDLRADLLVLGSHGRSGFERLLLGSVPEKLLRKSPCPTLIVPRFAPDSAPDAAVRFRTILCPVDFSEGSRRALAYALDLAEEAHAHLTVLHVIEVPPELNEDPLAPDFDVDRVRAAAEAEALRRLRELIPERAREYCTVETAVREGAAYRQVLQTAADRQADLIVMGIRGRGALGLMVFGSNTARVTRQAACPVLVVGTVERVPAT